MPNSKHCPRAHGFIARSMIFEMIFVAVKPIGAMHSNIFVIDGDLVLPLQF
jgi:hypothetical protein